MRREIKWNVGKFKEMYRDGASQWDIARHFETTQHAVWQMIKRLGLSRPNRAGIARTCFCGAPVWKYRDNRRDNQGFPILAGTRCLQHQREYNLGKQRRYEERHPGIRAEIARRYRNRKRLR